MELAILLYMASVAENLKSVVYVIGNIAATLAVILCFVNGCMLANQTRALGTKDEKTEDRIYLESCYRWTERGMLACLFLWAILWTAEALMPTKKDLYVIGGGYVALQAMKSDTATALKDKSLLAIENWLDSELAKTLDKAEDALVEKVQEKTKQPEGQTIELNGKKYMEIQ